MYLFKLIFNNYYTLPHISGFNELTPYPLSFIPYY